MNMMFMMIYKKYRIYFYDKVSINRIWGYLVLNLSDLYISVI